MPSPEYELEDDIWGSATWAHENRIPRTNNASFRLCEQAGELSVDSDERWRNRTRRKDVPSGRRALPCGFSVHFSIWILSYIFRRRMASRPNASANGARVECWIGSADCRFCRQRASIGCCGWLRVTPTALYPWISARSNNTCFWRVCAVCYAMTSVARCSFWKYTNCNWTSSSLEITYSVSRRSDHYTLILKPWWLYRMFWTQEHHVVLRQFHYPSSTTPTAILAVEIGWRFVPHKSVIHDRNAITI